MKALLEVAVDSGTFVTLFSAFLASLGGVEVVRRIRRPLLPPHSALSSLLLSLVTFLERRRFSAPLPEPRPSSRSPSPSRPLSFLPLPSCRLHSMGPMPRLIWDNVPRSGLYTLAARIEGCWPRRRRPPKSQTTSYIRSRRPQESFRSDRRASWRPRAVSASRRPLLPRNSRLSTPLPARVSGSLTLRCELP